RHDQGHQHHHDGEGDDEFHKSETGSHRGATPCHRDRHVDHRWKLLQNTARVKKTSKPALFHVIPQINNARGAPPPKIFSRFRYCWRYAAGRADRAAAATCRYRDTLAPGEASWRLIRSRPCPTSHPICPASEGASRTAQKTSR